MSDGLDIHWASPDERLAAFTNVHEFWGQGRSLQEHLQQRLSSPQHQRALWGVGCWRGRVVSSLGCYPMQFRLEGRLLRGFSLGAVHTLPEFRGKGFAPRVIRWVEQQQRNTGAALSLLFSDIDPDYYARWGYRRCPSHELDIDLQADDYMSFKSDITLSPCEPTAEVLGQFEQLYERAHRDYLFSVVRDREYWSYLWSRDRHDRLFRVQRCGTDIGLIRLGGTPARRLLRDLAIEPGEQDRLADIVAAVAREASNGGRRLAGWAPPDPLRRLATRERLREITMLRWLSDDAPPGDASLADARHLREIDHV